MSHWRDDKPHWRYLLYAIATGVVMWLAVLALVWGIVKYLT